VDRTSNTTIHLRHIEVYDAIAATGSTLAAATNLGISQSNASRLLQQLENYLGVRLFKRSKNRLSPTREGLQLGPEIRAISDRLRALKIAAIELENGRSRDLLLRLAFPASLSTTRVPAMIRNFLAINGPVRIEIISGNYPMIERMVTDGVADIGFTLLPLTTLGLKQERCLPSRMVCALPASHPLTERASISIADLKGQDIIMLSRERPSRHRLEALFHQYNVRQWPLLEAHSVASACALAAEGLGIALVGELIAQEYTKLPLRFIALEPELLSTYCLISSDKHPLPRTASLFLESIADWP